MQTVYEFELPRGYRDSEGQIHKSGKMRLAAAKDELTAMRDPRVQMNENYLTVILLSRVITELEGVEAVTCALIEDLYTADLNFLQDMYEKINAIEEPVMHVVCPHCGKEHEVPVNFTRRG